MKRTSVSPELGEDECNEVRDVVSIVSLRLRSTSTAAQRIL